MTDEHDQQLTPAQDAEVRRLLADARHTTPMPADVADRMDRVLEGLAAHPVEASSSAPVTRLAERRRRVVTLLVAAAAVVVVGIGLGQVISTSEAPEAVQSEGTDAGAGEQAPDAAEDRGRVTADADQPAALVRPGRFTDDVRRLRGTVTRTEADVAPAPQADANGMSSRKAGCEPGDWGPGVYKPVRYGRSDGFVVFRPTEGDTQVADLFLCGSDDVVRTVTLPSR